MTKKEMPSNLKTAASKTALQRYLRKRGYGWFKPHYKGCYEALNMKRGVKLQIKTHTGWSRYTTTKCGTVKQQGDIISIAVLLRRSHGGKSSYIESKEFRPIGASIEDMILTALQYADNSEGEKVSKNDFWQNMILDVTKKELLELTDTQRVFFQSRAKSDDDEATLTIQLHPMRVNFLEADHPDYRPEFSTANHNPPTVKITLKEGSLKFTFCYSESSTTIVSSMQGDLYYFASHGLPAIEDPAFDPNKITKLAIDSVEIAQEVQWDTIENHRDINKLRNIISRKRINGNQKLENKLSKAWSKE